MTTRRAGVGELDPIVNAGDPIQLNLDFTDDPSNIDTIVWDVCNDCKKRESIDVKLYLAGQACLRLPLPDAPFSKLRRRAIDAILSRNKG